MLHRLVSEILSALGDDLVITADIMIAQTANFQTAFGTVRPGVTNARSGDAVLARVRGGFGTLP